MTPEAFQVPYQSQQQKDWKSQKLIQLIDSRILSTIILELCWSKDDLINSHDA